MRKMIFFQDAGVDSSIFQNPDKLHLTVGTLVLLSNSEVENALHVLRQCQHEIIE